MARRKHHASTADFIAAAVCPVLIMGLVWSLSFFLLEVFYKSNPPSQLKWILFWYLFANVLIARIAMQMGTAAASTYGVVLAAATAFVIPRYVDAFVPAYVLLGVIWWCAHKLTWDCTLIDDSVDASGEGLLGVVGIDEGDNAADASENAPEPSDEDEKPASKKSKDKRPHTPGLWVVYFSLASLPLFGVGQTLLPADNGDARSYGFKLLLLYVASALGLLMLTSFLSLRRYLRQRRVRMPRSVVGTWITMGTGLAVAVLVACLLLPRPDAAYSMTALIDRVGDAVQEASDNAVLKGKSGKGEGREIGDENEQDKADGKGEQEDKAADNPDEDGKNGSGPQREKGDPSGKGKNAKKDGQNGEKKGKGKAGKNGDEKNGKQREDGQKAGQGDKGKEKGDEQQQGEEGQGDDGKQSDQSSSPPSSSSWSNPLSGIGDWVKFLLYAILGAVILVLLFKNRAAVGAWLQGLLQQLRDLFGSREKKEKRTEEELAAAAEEARKVPFSAFDNPFATGRAHQMPPQQLVRYTFDALDAWGRDNGLPRGPDQTPYEYVRHVLRQWPDLSDELRLLGQLYTGIAYSGRVPQTVQTEAMQRIWEQMTHGGLAVRA